MRVKSGRSRAVLAPPPPPAPPPRRTWTEDTEFEVSSVEADVWDPRPPSPDATLWWFVKFIGYPRPEWIEDKSVECDAAIADYLSRYPDHPDPRARYADIKNDDVPGQEEENDTVDIRATNEFRRRLLALQERLLHASERMAARPSKNAKGRETKDLRRARGVAKVEVEGIEDLRRLSRAATVVMKAGEIVIYTMNDLHALLGKMPYSPNRRALTGGKVAAPYVMIEGVARPVISTESGAGRVAVSVVDAENNIMILCTSNDNIIPITVQYSAVTHTITIRGGVILYDDPPQLACMIEHVSPRALELPATLADCFRLAAF